TWYERPVPRLSRANGRRLVSPAPGPRMRRQPSRDDTGEGVRPRLAFWTIGHTRLRRQHLYHHESNIVHRLDVTAKRGEAIAYRAHDFLRRAPGTFADDLAQAILAVLLALRVGHFPDAVGADEENLTGPKGRGSPLAVFHVVHHSQRQIAFTHFREAVHGVKDNHRVVPRADPAHRSGPRVDDREVHGHEAVAAVVGGNEVVQPAHQL